ncbi:bifunctional lysylphosphatidylglycerol flippase/synthetase MprF [Kineococcus sp. NPDC059986]|uniref:bifunctional lysylphosphatidylglycerol flippase/synthetase MprF n=1 Tax=Kineococcus sp. NPDC059986 TaxID=3155538 RepID=UPI00344EC509
MSSPTTHAVAVPGPRPAPRPTPGPAAPAEAAAPAAPGRHRGRRRLLGAGAVLVLLAVAGVMLHGTFGRLSGAEFGAALRGLGPGALLPALALTVLSLLLMTGYDALALRHVGRPLPYRCYGLAAFVATALGNGLGASAVVGAAVRARLYTRWGVPGADVARVVAVNLVTLVLGAAVLAGGGALVAPHAVATALRVPVPAVLAVAGVLVGLVVAHLVLAVVGPHEVRIGRLVLHRPTLPLACAQVVLSTVEWLTMAAVLYVLLPATGRPSFLPFAVAFATATVAGLLSSSPGGVGVFESCLLLLTGPLGSPAHVAAALVVYRVCYFLLPVVPAALALAVHEARSAGLTRLRLGRGHGAVPAQPRALVPGLLALGVAAAGAAPLLAGGLPVDLARPTTLLVALTAVLLALGLQRRLRSAWGLTLALGSTVAVLALVHADVVCAAVSGGLSVLLVHCRSRFHRGALLPSPFAAPLAPVLATVLVGAAVTWHEALAGAGPADPVLDRLALVAGAAGVLVGGRWLARTATAAPRPGGVDGQCPVELARVDDLVAKFGRCLSHLAFTGDKRFHFSPTGAAFLMYQVRGRSWVVMGDPVGEVEQVRDLVADFVTHVDRHGGRPVFYNVTPDHAELYRACGLTLAKLGEEAVLDLEGFSLAGKARVGLRNCRNKSQRLGMSVEFVAAADVDPLLPQLREVSQAWLTHRNGREKRFSLGAFDEEYVRRFPLAVVRQDGRITAFATLWTSADGRDVQVDLMRRLPDGPRTVMTYLFVECILWAQERGCATFNLGMAPLAGLRAEEGPTSVWDLLGHLVWTHGERFYNFQGLRTFKQGFAPRWQACYVASPGGPALTSAMVDVVTLVGGGVRGVLRG